MTRNDRSGDFAMLPRILAVRASLIALALLGSAGSALANSPPLVSNVVAHQRVGTYLVDVTYDVADANGDALEVTAFLSIDGGATYPIPLVTASGAIGAGVQPGVGHTLVWNAGVDYPNFNGSNCSVRVIADDGRGIEQMLVLFDRSGTMSIATSGVTRYDAVHQGLSAFFGSPAHSGLMVGLNFFPVGNPPELCNPALHNPPQVPMGELTGHATTLEAAMAAQIPGNQASTHPALNGSLAFLVAHKQANPRDPTFAVLITDGAATACDMNFSSLNSLAAAALSNGVRTYVISIEGSDLAQFNALAVAGGTAGALLVNPGANRVAELVAALNTIYGIEAGP